MPTATARSGQWSTSPDRNRVKQETAMLSNSTSTARSIRPSPFGSSVVWIGGPCSDRPGVESTLGGLGLQLRWATGRRAGAGRVARTSGHAVPAGLHARGRGAADRAQHPHRAAARGAHRGRRSAAPGDLARGVPRRGLRHPSLAAGALGAERRHLERPGPAGAGARSRNRRRSGAGVAVRHLRHLAGDAEDRRSAAACGAKSLSCIALRRAWHRSRDVGPGHPRPRPPARRAICGARLRQRLAAGPGARAVRRRVAAARGRTRGAPDGRAREPPFAAV